MDEENKNTDQLWKQFVRQGDEQSFEKIFRSCYERMYGYGIKLCDRPSVVKDCIHDLFETVWERREDLGHIHSPNVYLFVSLRRKIRRSKKDASKKCKLNEIDESSFMQFSREELLINNEAKIEQRDELQQAFNQLTGQQKEIIFLRFYNGMSYKEIEQILSIDRQSVRNHVYRGMETLRSLTTNEIMRLVLSFLLCMIHFI